MRRDKIAAPQTYHSCPICGTKQSLAPPKFLQFLVAAYSEFVHQGPTVTEISLVTGGINAVCNCRASVPSGAVTVTVTGLGPRVVWPNRRKITCPLASVRAAGRAGKVPSTTTCALGNSVPLAWRTVTRILPARTTRGSGVAKSWRIRTSKQVFNSDATMAARAAGTPPCTRSSARTSMSGFPPGPSGSGCW